MSRCGTFHMAAAMISPLCFPPLGLHRSAFHHCRPLLHSLWCLCCIVRMLCKCFLQSINVSLHALSQSIKELLSPSQALSQQFGGSAQGCRAFVRDSFAIVRDPRLSFSRSNPSFELSHLFSGRQVPTTYRFRSLGCHLIHVQPRGTLSKIGQ